jgi:hypothetical protein
MWGLVQRTGSTIHGKWHLADCPQQATMVDFCSGTESLRAGGAGEAWAGGGEKALHEKLAMATPHVCLVIPTNVSDHCTEHVVHMGYQHIVVPFPADRH